MGFMEVLEPSDVDCKTVYMWHHFADNGLSSQSYGFSSSRVRMWELDH